MAGLTLPPGSAPKAGTDPTPYDGSNPEVITDKDTPPDDDPKWDVPLIEEEPSKGYQLPAFIQKAQAEDRAQRLARAQEMTSTLPEPDAAAGLREQASARALPFTHVLADPTTVEAKPVPTSWSNYATNTPLSDVLLDPEKAVLVKDEADRLAKMAGFDKEPPPGNRATVALQSGNLGLEESHLWTKKGMNGGVLPPGDEDRLKSIEARLMYLPQPKGMLDEAIGMAPMLGGNLAAAGAGAALGAAPGLVVPGLAPVGAALGAKAGSLAFNADLLVGQNYKQYAGMGMPHNVAWPAAVISGGIAAGIDTITFGLLAKIPALQMLSKVPGVEALNKTNIGPAMAAALKDSRFAKLLTSLGKDAATGATGNALMEAVGILGAYAANMAAGGQYQTPTANEAAARVFHAAGLGATVGTVLGGAGTLFHETLSKISVAETSAPVIDRLYDVTENLKSSERAPDVVAKYGNELGKNGPVKYLTMPVDELSKLLDQHKDSPVLKAWLAREEVKRGLDEARSNGTRVTVPLGDFVAYIRPLDKSRTLNQLIGLNDEMSPAEAKLLKPAVEKARKEMSDAEARRKSIESGPEGMIVADLEKKLRAVGGTVEGSRIQAELVASGVSTLARRAGQNPWETYRKAPITISRQSKASSLLAYKNERTLDQADPTGVKGEKTNPGKGRAGYLLYQHPESPLQLRVYEQPKWEAKLRGNDEPARMVGLLSFDKNTSESKANREKFGGQGYSTALYLRALMDAKSDKVAFSSDTIRTDATEKMYARLQGLGIPFELKKSMPELGADSADYFHITSEKLRATDLDAAWKKLQDEVAARSEDHGPLKDASDKEISDLVGGLKELQQKQRDDVRGQIAFNPDTRDAFHITLTGKANLSTFLHESSHYMLELMRKLDGETGKFGDDLRKLEEWAGVKPGEEWSDAALEKFARGMETYFGEGKAPSAKLAGAFATFKSWILHVYRTLTSLGAPLTDEVRSVMDRMLATDQEISARRLELGYFPNELILKHGDMDAESQQRYRDLYEKGAAQAQVKLDRDAIAALRAEKSADYKRVSAEVDRSLDNHPVIALRSFLVGEGRTDGGIVPDVVGKLDAEAVRAKRLVGVEGRIKDFLADRGGIDPDELAPYFGFKNGSEMLQALASTPARSTLKSAITKSEFTKLYPAYGPDPSWVEKSALEQLHGSDAVANAIEIELRVLYKKAGLQPPESPALVARQAAQSAVSELATADLHPAKYREAEARMLREQQAALVAKDFGAAAEATRKRIYNRAMWQEVQKAANEVKKAEMFIKHYSADDALGRLGRSSEMVLPTGERVGFVIRDAMKTLLESTGFSEESAVSREHTFDSHVSKLEEAGLPVTIDPVLLERPLRDWADLSYMEAMAVKDAVKNLTTIARGLNTIRLEGKAEELSNIAAQIRANLEKSKLLDRLGEKGEQKNTVRHLRAETTKPETIALDIDGGEPGIFHKLFIQTIEEGQYEKDRRFRQRRAEITELGKQFRPEGWAKQMKQKFLFEDGREYSGAEAFAMLLNFGTASNRDKLLRGMERAGRQGWTEENVLGFIHRVFPDRAAYDYAQAILKYTNRPDLWDDAANVRERVSGVRPEKVPALAIPTPDGGSIEGGYYHLVYDRKVPLKEAEATSADALNAMHDANPLNLYAANGFMKGRTNYAAPLLLDPTVWAAHLYEVDHFIAHAEGIINRHKLLQHPGVKEALIHSIGFDYWEQLKLSNNYIAADGQLLTREVLQLSRGVDKLIYHNALLTMGGNLLSGVNQVVTGLPATVAKLGVKGLPAFTKALVDFVKSPFQTWKDVATESGEIRDMDFHYDRDLRLVIAREMTGESADHVRARIAATTMTPVVFGQKMVNVITFKAAKALALNDGKSTADAVAYANSIVRQTQSSSSPMDHTAVQRSRDGLMRIMTSLASYTFSLNDMVMPRRMTQKELTGAVVRIVSLTTTTAMAKAMFDVLTPKLEQKDEERRKGVLKMAEDAEYPGLVPATEALMSVLGNVPVLGRPAESLLTGREPRFASWVNTAVTAAKAGVNVAQGNDLTKHELKAAVEAVGLATGIPTRHLFFAPGEFAYEVMNGNIEETPWSYFQEMALVRPGQKGEKK